MCYIQYSEDLQSQRAVTDHLKTKQLLPSVLAQQIMLNLNYTIIILNNCLFKNVTLHLHI